MILAFDNESLHPARKTQACTKGFGNSLANNQIKHRDTAQNHPPDISRELHPICITRLLPETPIRGERKAKGISMVGDEYWPRQVQEVARVLSPPVPLPSP